MFELVCIHSKGPILLSTEIDVFTDSLGCDLPSAYKGFLLENNGGVPEPNIIDIINFDQSPTDIQVFFGINREIEVSNISWNIDTFEFLSGKFIPIGCDSGGNLFCINVFDAAGAVVYFDLQSEDPVAYEVARDFEAFFEKIRDF